MDDMKNTIHCTGHMGIRYIDSLHCDIRTVCDRCGREEYQDFGSLAKDRKSVDNCIQHGCAMQNDILGRFCVYCIIERTAKKAEDMGYTFK